MNSGHVGYRAMLKYLEKSGFSLCAKLCYANRLLTMTVVSIFPWKANLISQTVELFLFNFLFFV